MNNLGSFGYVCWVEFPFHVLLLSSSSSLLWSWWIPDETPPRTLWCTPQLPCKKKKKNSKKDWHVTLARKEFRCWSWFCFMQAQIHKKKLFYSLKTATQNIRLSFCLWNLQIVIIEYFVQSHQWKNMCIFKHSKVV